ncbi:MAG TPA: hypothetical protein VF339_08720 [Gammaproteobacteria bacterium]
MDVFENLPPIVVLVLGFVLIAWLVLVFLVPFMIEGIRQSARKSHEELVEMNAKLDRLNALLSQGRPAARAGYAEPTVPDPPEPRGRREPTISEPAVHPSGSRNRREPIVR